jgi:hypothetical protein
LNKKQESLKNWFEIWWQRLPSRLFTSQSKGSKKRCYENLQKLNPDDDLMKEISDYTQEKARTWKTLMNKGVKVDPWQHAERMIKNEFWNDDLPCVSESIQKGTTGKICDECQDVVHGPAYTKCTLHQALLTSDQNGDTQMLRDQYKKLKLHSFSRTELIAACKKLCGRLGVSL